MISERNSSAYHGGAFWEAIGDGFDDLSRAERVVNADVLDAWFPPAPRIVDQIREHLPWLIRTSPPTHVEGFRRTVAETRRVPVECVLPGAGSSALMFLAIPRWVPRGGRALVLDPSYGEYPHLLERVLGVEVIRHRLSRGEGFRPDLDQIARQVSEGIDFVAIVNPNSPTGVPVSGSDLRNLIDRCPETTRFWIDETYTDYAGDGLTLETLAAERSNVVVSKSMSKAYALSGLRVAYLVAPPTLVSEWTRHAPPWSVDLPAQIAGTLALTDRDYYPARWAETARLRNELSAALKGLDFEVVDSATNFVFALGDRLPLKPETIADRCRDRGVYIRTFPEARTDIRDSAIRVAVKSPEEQDRVLEALRSSLSP
ncbi:MAG: histidinol-phosphate transaminase [Fimbriimonadaceae bacterium]